VSRSLAALSAGLPPGVQLWIGGAGSGRIAQPGVERKLELDLLERRAGLLVEHARSPA
jgi:hypothetical protein